MRRRGFKNTIQIWLLALLAALPALAACGGAPAPTTPPTVPPTPTAVLTPTPDVYWPTTTWRTSTPEAQDMDSARLEQMMALIEAHDIDIDAVLVVRHGHLVWEAYRNGYDRDQAHHLQSVTKSVTSLLIGIALEQGLIEGIDQKLLDFFPGLEIQNRDARKERITLAHLLTMSEGLDWHEHDYAYTDRRNTLRQMWVSPDAVQYVLDRPMAREPGQAWAYNSGTSILLGGVLERVTGQDVLAFARTHLFDPLGIGEVRWDKTAGQHYHTDGGLYMTPRDMARLGYLMLHQGAWEGRQIVSPEWVADSVQARYRTPGGIGYGYQWWSWPESGVYEVYGATGHFEQRIFVVPAADMVAVFTANIADQDPHVTDPLLYRYILAACTDLPQAGADLRYANYGFSIDYPAGASVVELPLPGSDALSSAAGMVQFTLDLYPLEITNVRWQAVPAAPAPDVKAALEALLDSLSQPAGSQVTFGERGQTSRDGHPLFYQSFTLTQGGLTFSGVAGAWYCEASGRLYILSYVTQPETGADALLAAFQGRLDGFDCHEEE